MDERLRDIVDGALDFKSATGISAAVFEYSIRRFTGGMECSFCVGCGGCDYQVAHTYGCFEAERWQGLYVYYCPISLAFIATSVYSGARAEYAFVSGPIIMGQPEDLQLPESLSGARNLPVRGTREVNAISGLQSIMARFFSGDSASQIMRERDASRNLLSTLYDVTDQIRSGQGTRYPIEIEQRLQHMITQGDKHGAQELINQLLGTLYFNTFGDFNQIKERAKELIILFSRASAEGGADVRKIFGQNRDLQAEIDRLTSLDELSVFLTSIFYRFVGYVFDFGKFEHADILHKAVGFMRENLSEKLTLEDLALHVGLSRSYLSTIIKSELGSTFTDYMNTLRVNKSKELLLDDKLSLADIAAIVGYGDQSYFTKKFVQQVGISPGQFRKKRGHTAQE